MSKVVYKTSASNNNDFQKALMKTLKTMGIHPNVGLDILETDDKKVVIQKWGDWNYEINFKADETPDRKIIHLYGDGGEHEFVKLTEDQYRLLEWLKKEDLIRWDWYFEEMENIEIKEI